MNAEGPGPGAADVVADRPVSWRRLLVEVEQRLALAGVETAAVEARRLVEEASGHRGTALFLALDEPAPPRRAAELDALVERRVAGEPLQYVLGHWAFRLLDLLVDRRVLIPRPETEQVCELALTALDDVLASPQRPRGEPAVAVDLGAGSGALALSIAVERPGVEVWAVERSPDAAAVCRANVSALGRAVTAVRVVEGSWFDPLPDGLRGRVDLVVSNPPYVAAADPLPAEVADWEPAEALVPGPTGLEAVAELVARAPSWLRPGGALVVEIGDAQGAAAAGLATAAGFARVSVEPDLTGRDRALVAWR